jgi:hypothetical protein
MTVRRGEIWGRTGRPPAGLVEVRSDAELHALVDRSRRANEPIPPVGLLGGDLCRTLGGVGSQERLHGEEAFIATVDLGCALLDGRIAWFAAHAIARRSWWRGPIVAAMVAEYAGEWDLAPRGHPADGRFDLIEVDAAMGAAQRWKARRRLSTGTFVPHPAITTRTAANGAWELPAGQHVWLDGVDAGECRNLVVRVEPDAYTVCV